MPITKKSLNILEHEERSPKHDKQKKPKPTHISLKVLLNEPGRINLPPSLQA